METKHLPFVSASDNMKEFSLRAVLLGVFLAMFMGAANAYLGLKAGMTIAATYTTAVIGMAVIKMFKGTILEENTARTVGSIGGNIATGAIFTLPAFFIAGIWNPFYSVQHYVVSTIILVVGGILGIMFVTITRRVLVESAELPFPESVAASEIHKAGQKGASGSGLLLSGMGLGVLVTILTEVKLIAMKWQSVLVVGKGRLLLRGPEMSPAFFGVGYIIGPKLAGVNFSGGVLAWGLIAPALAYFLHYNDSASVTDWASEITFVWKNYVRYIAIGGMLVGAFFTLYKMRNSLWQGLRSSFTNLRGAAAGGPELLRTEKDIPIRYAGTGIALITIIMFFIFNYFAGSAVAAAVAAIVMLFLGFVFAAVSGYLVGIIGVSSNPTSGLTVSVLIVVAFLMVMMGLEGNSGIAAVLGVAAFTCVSVSVAGEMMQDLKAGHILGCTPWKMQLGDIFGVTAAALVMFFILSILHLGDIKQKTTAGMDELRKSGTTEINYSGDNSAIEKRTYTVQELQVMTPEQQNEILGTNAGFGGDKIPAPQASLMAVVAKSIMLGKTEWILILIGIFMGLSFILMQIKSPMLVSVGMYLPIETSFAIFIGGLFRGWMDQWLDKKKMSSEGKEAAGNRGILLASGFIAGEALIGILFAAFAFAEIDMPKFLPDPSYMPSILLMLVLGFVLIYLPIRKRSQ
jgi:putative OPT family oligopeptide transporter